MRKDPTEFRLRFAAWKNGELVYEHGLPKFATGTEGDEDQNAAAGAYIGAIPFILKENDRNTKRNKLIDEQIAKRNSYGWDNSIRSYALNSPQWLVNNVNPAWNIVDMNILKIPFGVQDMSGATKDDNAFFRRHLGYLRDLESMPITGIRFAGDYNEDESLRLPNAEYTGLSKKAKDFIRKGILNGKIKPKEDGSWTEIDEHKTHWGKDTSHLGTYSIRENNGSGIYDIVDTYDFPWYNPILNRESGKQIEVRDTIHGPNANPYFYNFKYSKNKKLPRYRWGTEEGTLSTIINAVPWRGYARKAKTLINDAIKLVPGPAGMMTSVPEVNFETKEGLASYGDVVGTATASYGKSYTRPNGWGQQLDKWIDGLKLPNNRTVGNTLALPGPSNTGISNKTFGRGMWGLGTLISLPDMYYDARQLYWDLKTPAEKYAE